MEPKASSSYTVVSRLGVGPLTHLRLSGVIDETFSSQAFAKEMIGHVLLDLGRVERISSFGVRKWIEFTGKLPNGAQALYIINAPPVVVDQLNMVEGFAGVTRVLSVLAPYSCNVCGEDKLKLVDLRAEAAVVNEGKAPQHSCPVCQNPLQFADLPAEFFDYARHQQLGPVEQAVSNYLRTLSVQPPSEAEQAPATHLKLVHEDITYFRVSNVLRGDLNVRRLSAGLEGRVVYDFGNVSTVEPEAGPKLAQIFEAASQTAKVILWRVPPAVLLTLARMGRSLHVGLATLYLPCECRNCGSKSPQRIEAAAYLKALQAGNVGERPCPICGGKATIPGLKEAARLLSSTPLVSMRLEEVEALEPRALSQYLAGSVAQEGEAGKSDAGTGNYGSSLRLQILRRLGQGGMAEVFLARQVGIKGFEKYVVVKKILENFAQQPDFVEMLFAEARANARLTHQNIVQTFNVDTMNGVAQITMEYVRGPDIKKLMMLMRKAGERVPVQYALRIVAETAAGLHYAHSYVDPTGTPHPMVHRDVSPHNILLSLDGAIKLSDFGIAKVQGEAENTRPGTFKGKIAYLSPEAIAGMPVDARSDVFALGTTLFELLTGRLPFRRENEAATLHAIMREPAPNPAKLNPAVPEDLAAVVLKSLEKDPARRTRSAGEFREEIEMVMMRHQWSITPTSVAQFFLEKLGPQLAEYSPNTGAGTGAGSNSGISKPSIANLGTGGGTGSQAALKHDEGSKSRRAIEAPAAAALSESSHSIANKSSAGRSTGRGTAELSRPAAPPSQRSPTGTGHQLTPSMPRDVSAPAARVPFASRSMSQASVEPPAPAPRPPPEPPRIVPPARPTAQVAPPPPAPAPQPQPEQRRSYWGWILAGVALASAILGGIVFWLNNMGDRIPVLNLPADEQLYISGLRVDPSNIQMTGAGPLMVSTAQGGKLRRLGTASRESGSIDVGLLIVESSDHFAGQADLSVHSDPLGCAVIVDGERKPSSTPMSTKIEAGKEIEVEVRCEGRAKWTQWVMAAPGQSVEMHAAPPDR